MICVRCSKAIDRNEEGDWVDDDGYISCDGWGAPHETHEEREARMNPPLQQEEAIVETALVIKVTSEAPYAESTVKDYAKDIADTLDFTGMFSGSVRVERPNGEVLREWDLGTDYDSGET